MTDELNEYKKFIELKLSKLESNSYFDKIKIFVSDDSDLKIIDKLNK